MDPIFFLDDADLEALAKFKCFTESRYEPHYCRCGPCRARSYWDGRIKTRQNPVENPVNLAHDMIRKRIANLPGSQYGTSNLLLEDLELLDRALLKAKADGKLVGNIRSQAYQVIGTLLSTEEHSLKVGFESDAGQRALDYFASGDYDEDFLPWPATGESTDD